MTGHSYIAGVYHYDAIPLELGDPVYDHGDFSGEDVTKLGDAVYMTDDLYVCSCCKSVHVSRSELDDESECEDCAEESRQEAAAEDEKWADYRADCR